MVVAVVVLAVVYVLTAVVGVALWLGLRRHQWLIDGLRRESAQLVMALHERITSEVRWSVSRQQEHDQRLDRVGALATTAHNTAAVANDRILYYTKHSAILERIGAKYDKAIAALRAKAEGVQAPAAPEPDQDSAPEGTAQSEGIAGSIGIPCG